MFKLNSILHGNCLDVMKTFPDNCIDMTLTSPPYDNLRYYNGYEFDFENIAKELFRITKEGGVIVWVVGDATIKGSETGTSFKQALYFKELGFNLHDTMIYQKNGTGACGSNYCYWQSFEYMFVFSKGKIKTVNRLTNGKPRSKGGVIAGRRNKDGTLKIEHRSCGHGKEQIRTNVWLYNVGFLNKTKHPAVFPEQLAEDHILSWSREGDTILDPMAGSGTTLKMAKLNKRDYIGIELSSDYINIINERLSGV